MGGEGGLGEEQIEGAEILDVDPAPDSGARAHGDGLVVG